jgi:hypothetical protein
MRWKIEIVVSTIGLNSRALFRQIPPFFLVPSPSHHPSTACIHYQKAEDLLETGLDRALVSSDWTTTVSIHLHNSMTHLIHKLHFF